MVSTPNQINLPVAFSVDFDGFAGQLEDAGRTIRKAFASQPQPGHEHGGPALKRLIPDGEVLDAYKAHGGSDQLLMVEPF